MIAWALSPVVDSYAVARSRYPFAGFVLTSSEAFEMELPPLPPKTPFQSWLRPPPLPEPTPTRTKLRPKTTASSAYTHFWWRRRRTKKSSWFGLPPPLCRRRPWARAFAGCAFAFSSCFALTAARAIIRPG